VRFWSSIDAKSIRPPLKLGEAITHVVFSADRSNLLASDGRFTARLWSAAEGVPVGKPMTHSGTIRALAFHPDGQIVLTGGEDNTARFWHAGTGQPIAGRIEPTGNRASDVGFGNSGSGEPIGGRLRHFGDVVNAGFSPDGMMAVTGEVEGAARLWRVPVPVEGDRARIETWIQVITGMELDASNAVRFLDAEEWRERKRQLGE
jgi:WD40 repeat protein